jgi:hypothetical protein
METLMACFVCGGGPHAPYALHSYWPEPEALAAFQAEAGQAAEPSLSAAETFDAAEAVYL